jgi:ABC-type branched-subunit amino acid transport system substrate-binding protein
MSQVTGQGEAYGHMSQRRHIRVVSAMLGLSLLAAACGDDDDDAGSEDPEETTESTAADDGGAEGDGGALAGMKGTTPLIDLSDEFKDRLLEVNPDLSDFNYAAESYDATVIISLATAKAGSDGIEMANEINGITRGGEKCDTFEACMAIIDAGGDPDYDGASGPMEFSGNGEPTVASYGILQFGDDNRIDDEVTEFVVANAPAEADVEQQNAEGTRAGDGELKIGTILPETGSLAFLGPPEFAGVDLALAEVNAAGGVLGKPIGVNVDAIIGAASSGVTATVIDKITAAGVVQFSPANTSKSFSDYADKGLYFRNAPSDILQGQVLGEVIAADGHTTVGILALDDPYGTGLAEDLTTALEDSGIEVVESIIYDPAAQTFDAQTQDIVSADPEAIVIIGFDESSRIVANLVEQGVGPADKAIYGVDGNMGNALGENFDAGK